MQVGGLSKELGRLFRRVLTPRLVPPALRDSLQLATVRGGVLHGLLSVRANPNPHPHPHPNPDQVRGVILHGPPGTGKTLIARKIGALLQIPLTLTPT